MRNLQDYEYKAPSYERVKREHTYVIDEAKEQDTSRYYLKDGVWYRKDADASAPKDEISLLFAGDLLCQEYMMDAYRKEDGRFDFNACFEFVRPLLKASDFCAGNLETPVSDEAPYRGEIITHEGPFFCNAPVEYLAALKYAGFDMLTTANNHTLDAGADGLLDTIENAEKFGFIQTGTFSGKSDKFVVVDICGIKVGFTAFGTTYNMMSGNLTRQGRIDLLNTYSLNRASGVLKKMKKLGAEYTVCFPHWGEEYTDKITAKQSLMAAELAGLGYDLIAGSHSHVVQKFTEVAGTPVLFSMGNLISHLNHVKRNGSEYPLLMNLKLRRDGEKIVSAIDFIPCRIFKKIKGVPYSVVPVSSALNLSSQVTAETADAADAVAELLQCDSSVLNLDYPADKAVAAELADFYQNRKERLAVFGKVPDLVGAAADAAEAENRLEKKKPLLSKWDTETRVGKYKKVLGGLKLLCLDSKATVIKMDNDVDGRDVKAVENSYGFNDTARIIYLGKKVKTVGKGAFANFSQLESVRFYESVQKIEDNAFSGCGKLTGITLAKGVKSIGKNAFADCPNLMSIKMPSNVTKIDKTAFDGCPKLTIYCNENSAADKFAKENHIPVKYMPL